MREQAEQEATRQRRRLAKLTSEREKLLHAYHAGAVPVDLFRQEQDRLAGEIAQTERHLENAGQSFGEVQVTLDKALDLLANCEGAYRKAPGHLRRQWNQRSSSGSLSTTIASTARTSPSPRYAHRPRSAATVRRRCHKRNRRLVGRWFK